MASDLFEAYLCGQAGDFYNGHFTSPGDRRRAVMRALRPIDEDVADALEAQQAKLSPSTARAQHLAALRRGAAAVVTGQQAGLFLGPLYTLYKAATAVRLARALSDEVGQPVVPIFWLQSEDHDLREIATCRVRTAGAPLTVALSVAEKNRIPVAHYALAEDVQQALAALRKELANLPHAEEHLSRLARHYQPGAGWVQAFAGCLAELFAEAGLVLVDPRDPALARAAIPVHRRALLEAEAISRALLARVRMLEAGGWQGGVHIRDGSPLSFFHPQGAAGPRFRLSPAPGGFAEVGGERVHGLRDLLDWLERDPQRFSTSALLRPILQDCLLPTAAYVGGPAEVVYSAQVAPLYAAYGLPATLVVPRARFRILEPRTEALLVRTQLAADDVCRPEDELIRKLAANSPMHSPPDVFERDLRERLEAALREALAKAHAEHSAELRMAEHGMRTILDKAVAKLRHKYEQALHHRNHLLIEEIKRLKALLHPEREPQERFYGISYFAARYGEWAFVAKVLDSVTPFDAAIKDLRL